MCLHDAAQLAQIHAASFTTTPRPWSAAEIAALLSDPLVFVISCGEANRPEGFIMGRAVAGEAELLTLAVAPQARRLGHGRSLVAAFLAEAKLRHATQIFLEVSAENPAAIALYEAAGFSHAGRRRGYYHAPDGRAVDALVMQAAPKS